MQTPVIQLKNASCTFYARHSRIRIKKVHALADITLDIYKGETLGFIGHNGAGKSTMLQLLGGILAPTAGKIITQEGLTTSLLSLQLGFAPELTGRENAVLGSLYLGHTKKEAEARLDHILDFAEIQEWADDPIRTYSTGMRARLGFAVALEMHADVMLIDETLGVGDAHFQKKSSSALLQKMQQGQTTVLVSHSEATMQSLCTRVAWLHEGKLRSVGKPQDVLGEYNAWVKSLSAK